MSATADRELMDRAVTYLVRHYSPYGGRIGWIILMSIFIEAWGLYSIGYMLIFVREAFSPSPPLARPPSSRIGQRGLGISGFSIVFASLLLAAFALHTNNLVLLPVAAAAMMWGHNWDSQNCVTISAMKARPEYRGTNTGFAYMFVKLLNFLAIFLFPVLFTAIAKVN